MKVKGTGSRCLLEECVKDNYYARFHRHSYHCCKEMMFIPRLGVNFLDSTQIVDGHTDDRTNGRKVEPLYRTLLKAGGVKTDFSMKQLKFEADRKVPKFSNARKPCCNQPKIQTMMPNLRVFHQKDANGKANSEDPDHTAPLGAV